ncbi:MAG: phenylalanine--tRNA ligase subunit alpha, partial [Planctomycetota bacterium]
MRDRLEKLRSEGARAIAQADPEGLRAAEIRLLGRKGELTALLKGVGSLDPAERPQIGKLANEVKAALSEAIRKRREELERASLENELSASDFDSTLPGPPRPREGLHPITRIARELEDLFSS